MTNNKEIVDLPWLDPAIASKIYQSFFEVSKQSIDQESVQRIIREAVSTEKREERETTKKSNEESSYHSNCVVESKQYFGESFEPGLHHRSDHQLNFFILLFVKIIYLP